VSFVASALVKMVEHNGVLIGPKRFPPVSSGIVFRRTLIRREEEDDCHNDIRQSGTLTTTQHAMLHYQFQA
tara:strand:+ start:675 stop:887 length:213 start_codon:yes stop_codon:yes gene_type:complete